MTARDAGCAAIRRTVTTGGRTGEAKRAMHSVYNGSDIRVARSVRRPIPQKAPCRATAAPLRNVADAKHDRSSLSPDADRADSTHLWPVVLALAVGGARAQGTAMPGFATAALSLRTLSLEPIGPPLGASVHECLRVRVSALEHLQYTREYP